MKELIEKIKSELNETLQIWNNAKSIKVKVGLGVIFVLLVALKIFTTVLTFEWLASLF